MATVGGNWNSQLDVLWDFLVLIIDTFGILFNYILPNAEVIIGYRSIENSSKYENIVSKYVRAFYTFDLYHLRP